MTGDSTARPPTAARADDPVDPTSVPAPIGEAPAPPTEPEEDPELAEAVRSLRSVILAGEHYRLAVATHLGISVNESQAISYLFAEGPLRQTDLAQRMNLTTSTVTGLLDRLADRVGGVADTELLEPLAQQRAAYDRWCEALRRAGH